MRTVRAVNITGNIIRQTSNFLKYVKNSFIADKYFYGIGEAHEKTAITITF